jgi:hypothetical protein
MRTIENIPVKNYELLKSVVGKIYVPKTAMEYWQKQLSARGAKKEEN